MAGYIGTIPVPQATESRSVFTATSNQTTFATGGYTPNLVSVFLNGVHLARADFAATNGTDVVLAAGAAADDTVEIIAFNAFEASSSTFTGDVIASGGTLQASGDTAAGDDAAIGYTAAEGLILTGQGSTSDITLKNDADAVVFTVPTGTDDILFPDNAKILMGAGSDLQLFHNGSQSYLGDYGSGDLNIQGTDVKIISNDSEVMADFNVNGAVELYHNNAVKLATSATGITVTGAIATSAGGVALTSLDIDGGTDIGAALVDADLMIVDDAAGGTNRKATMARLATYMGTKIGGGLEFISSTDISSAATFSFTGFDDSKYDNYKLFFANLTPANDSVGLSMVTSTDAGTNFDTGGSDYSRADLYFQNSYGQFTSSKSSAASCFLAGTFGTASGEEGGGCGEITIFGPHLAQFTQIQSKFFFITNGGLPALQITGFARSSAADVTAVKFAFSAGAIASGTFTAYGMVNS